MRVDCYVYTNEEKKYWLATAVVNNYIASIVGTTEDEAIQAMEAALVVLGYKAKWLNRKEKETKMSKKKKMFKAMIKTVSDKYIDVDLMKNNKAAGNVTCPREDFSELREETKKFIDWIGVAKDLK